jgi:hypothetical protein
MVLITKTSSYAQEYEKLIFAASDDIKKSFDTFKTASEQL